MTNQNPALTALNASSLAEAAEAYARDGLCVFPLVPRAKNPAVANGWHRATNDVEQVQEWWRHNPNYNIGLALERSGMAAIDIDPRHGGEDTWARHISAHAHPLTRVSLTGRGDGGRHLLFRLEGPRPKKSGLGAGIDVISNGYIVLPPSIHPDTGRPYQWDERTAGQIIPKLPTWVPTSAQETELFNATFGASGAPKAVYEEAKFLLKHIPNEDLSWDEWTAVGLALVALAAHASVGEENMEDMFFDLWESFSKGSEKYGERETAQKWDQMKRSPPTRTGMGALRSRADFWRLPYLTQDRLPMFLRHQLSSVHANEQTPIFTRYQDQDYVWNRFCYVPREDAVLRNEAQAWLERTYGLKEVGKGDAKKWVVSRTDASPTAVGTMCSALRTKRLLPRTTLVPSWLETATDKERQTDISNVLPVRNGVLDLRTFELFPLSPNLFTTRYADVDYDPEAECPRFLAFVNEIFDGTPQQIVLLQEVMGYLLSGDNSLEKVIQLFGPTRSGKGTLVKLLTHMMPDQHVAPMISSLVKDLETAMLIDKSLAFITDARDSRFEVRSKLVELMLAISGRDPVNLPRKNKTSWQGTLGTRFVMISNEEGEFPDPSGTFSARLVNLQTQRSFLGREDPDLVDKLLVERNGIFRWAMDGYRRVKANNGFTDTEQSREVREFTALNQRPEVLWLRENQHQIRLRPGAFTTSSYLFGTFKGWCEANGVRYSGGTPQFSRRLAKAVKEVFGQEVKAGHETANTASPRGYWGIEINASQDQGTRVQSVPASEDPDPDGILG